MTIREAMKMGITAVTREPWKSHNKYCRLELPVFPNLPGRPSGAWGRVIDPCSNLALEEPSERGIPTILLAGVNEPFNADPDEDAWEAWVEPADYARLGKRWSWATGGYADPEAYSLAPGAVNFKPIADRPPIAEGPLRETLLGFPVIPVDDAPGPKTKITFGPVREVAKDEKGAVLWERPYPFKRLFAAGQSLVENGIGYTVVSSKLEGNLVLTVLAERGR